MQNAVIYARFSSNKQSEESIDAQVRACRDYAEIHSIGVMKVYADEAVSGKKADRRQYQKMLRDAQKGDFDTILIHKYDRIARSISEHVNLEKRLNDLNIRLIATAQDFGTTNEAKIIRTLMWSLSEYYLDNLASETRKGLKETALKGLHNGGVAPFGYDIVHQKYVINDFEALYVRKIFDAALNKKGFTELIEEMKNCGIKGKRGKPIKYPQIYEILRNEKYTGVYIYSPEEEKNRSKRREKPNAIRIEGAIPAIIDEKTFMEVQTIMNQRKQTGKSKYLCSGLVYCSCGAKMHAAKSERKGHTYYYYLCSKHCGQPSAYMEDIDRVAKAYLHDLLSDINQASIMDALYNYKMDETQRKKDFYTILNKKIEEKERQYETLLSNLAGTAMPPAVVADITERMQSIKNEIECLKQTEPPKDYTNSTISSWLSTLKNAPDSKAVHLLIERIDVKNKTEFRVKSTLESVLGEIGCGRGI